MEKMMMATADLVEGVQHPEEDWNRRRKEKKLNVFYLKFMKLW